MKKLLGFTGLTFLISCLLVTSAHATFFPSQDVQVSCGAACSRETEIILIAANASSQADPYTEAEALLKEKKYDDVIRLLAGSTYTESTIFKLNLLLAKAQVEKCAILKANGDMSYKTLIHQPYEIGKRLNKINTTHPEPYYIVAKSLLINDRNTRARKTIKKALYFSPHNAEYLIVLGDACYAQGETVEKLGKDSSLANRFFSEAKDAYEKAIKNMGENAEEFRTNVEGKLKQVSEKMR
jgi:tetratricopeptide (TPR) repeat protein